MSLIRVAAKSRKIARVSVRVGGARAPRTPGLLHILELTHDDRVRQWLLIHYTCLVLHIKLPLPSTRHLRCGAPVDSYKMQNNRSTVRDAWNPHEQQLIHLWRRGQPFRCSLKRVRRRPDEINPAFSVLLRVPRSPLEVQICSPYFYRTDRTKKSESACVTAFHLLVTPILQLGILLSFLYLTAPLPLKQISFPVHNFRSLATVVINAPGSLGIHCLTIHNACKHTDERRKPPEAIHQG
jgi:hypothetical protein